LVDRIFERRHVFVPVGTLLDVVGRELPALVRVSQAALQAALLLVLGDMQIELEHRDARQRQRVLELVDRFVARLPDRFRDEILHPDDQHILIVGPVEDVDHPLRRGLLVIPPQEVMGYLFVRGSLE
jgi:hypothetical protein